MFPYGLIGCQILLTARLRGPSNAEERLAVLRITRRGGGDGGRRSEIWTTAPLLPSVRDGIFRKNIHLVVRNQIVTPTLIPT